MLGNILLYLIFFQTVLFDVDSFNVSVSLIRDKNYVENTYYPTYEIE